MMLLFLNMMLAVATLACCYYLILTSFRPRPVPQPLPDSPRTRFHIVIPAHNEAITLSSTLPSVLMLEYPRELFATTVIADNCQDETAEAARILGASVLERRDQNHFGKGYALQFATERILPTQPDVVLFLDADCECTPDLLQVLDQRYRSGERVVQTAIQTRNAAVSSSAFLVAIGNVFDNALSIGKNRLGFSAPLRGSGMAIQRQVLEQNPWRAFGLTEDAEYSRKLVASGVRIRFEPAARILSEAPVEPEHLYQQRKRWRTALFDGNGIWFRWLESKPLVLLQLIVTGLLVSLLGSFEQLLWTSLLFLLTGGIYLNMLLRVGQPLQSRTWLGIPVQLAGLVLVTLTGFFRRESRWNRTQRAGEPTQIFSTKIPYQPEASEEKPAPTFDSEVYSRR